MKLIQAITELLDDITMYRLTLYGLTGLAALSLLFGLTGKLSYAPGWQLVSLAALISAGYITNKSLAIIQDVPLNSESWLITSLILFLIMPPARTIQAAGVLMLVAIIAMASKFIIVYRRKNLFNPAAFAAAVLLVPATWWIGSSVMLPFTAILAVLMLLKLRQIQLFLAFGAAAFVASAIISLTEQISLYGIVVDSILSGPLVFLGSIMLTEPSTLPPTRNKRLVYAALVGTLLAVHPKIGFVTVSPELALLAGNLFAFAAGNRYRVKMTFKQRRLLAPNIYDFSFTPERPLKFTPGQYMEWTLPHVQPDGRGNRRSFSIASSPAEAEVHLGIKLGNPSSSYKRALLQLKPGDSLIAGQIAGDFTLPADITEKLVFIAGGIGITPFRSMLQDLRDRQAQHLDIVIFYTVKNETELIYQDVLEHPLPGVRYLRVTTGSLTANILTQAVPDLAERTIYLSGPDKMVNRHKNILRQLSVPTTKIKTDYFSGY